jgi:hypothetical protein
VIKCDFFKVLFGFIPKSSFTQRRRFLVGTDGCPVVSQRPKIRVVAKGRPGKRKHTKQNDWSLQRKVEICHQLSVTLGVLCFMEMYWDLTLSSCLHSGPNLMSPSSGLCGWPLASPAMQRDLTDAAGLSQHRECHRINERASVRGTLGDTEDQGLRHAASQAIGALWMTGKLPATSPTPPPGMALPKS